jgi:transcriptional regulator of met regulon
MNKDSYRYELIENEKGMFDNYIDMAYILTMEDSTRKESYMKQIQKYKPHKNILIQYNKGYKKSVKKLKEQTTANDINDAFYHAFKNAYNNNYQNIIIFEDDFFFDDTINQNIVDSIGNHITTNEYDLYHLGAPVHLTLPTFGEHLRAYFITSAHCIIYHRKYMEYYINKYEKDLVITNDLVWNDINIIKYIYHKPLCFQIFPETENRKSWGNAVIPIWFNRLLKLDEKHKPGYYITNILYRTISALIFAIVIFLMIVCMLKTGKIITKLV